MVPGLPTIAIAALGDPRSPRTWSSTAANLCRAFEEAGVEVTTIDFGGHTGPALETLLRIASKVYYLNSRYARIGRIETGWRAKRAGAFTAKAGKATHVLHIQGISFPFGEVDRRHSVMLDTTWHIWHRFSTDVFKVSPRLYRDAIEFERSVFQSAHHCFALSEALRRNLIEHYKVPAEKVTVIGTGRGALLPYHGPKDYTNGSVLFVAKERFADKGGHQVLEAVQLARRTNPDINLTIVGQPEYESKFAGIEGVRAYGHVPLDTLQRLFNEASLFALPARFEPWGLVYLEALACRTPVLGLSDHALPEITQHGRFGFCLAGGSVEEISNALLGAFENPERLARMGAEGQQHCLRHFTWQQTVRRIIDVLVPS